MKKKTNKKVTNKTDSKKQKVGDEVVMVKGKSVSLYGLTLTKLIEDVKELNKTKVDIEPYDSIVSDVGRLIEKSNNQVTTNRLHLAAIIILFVLNFI